jgi:hypothetical protein
MNNRRKMKVGWAFGALTCRCANTTPGQGPSCFSASLQKSLTHFEVVTDSQRAGIDVFGKQETECEILSLLMLLEDSLDSLVPAGSEKCISYSSTFTTDDSRYVEKQHGYLNPNYQG